MKKERDARAALVDAVEKDKAQEKWELSKYDNQALITELYTRGVTIKDIFGRYYEFESTYHSVLMDLEDAELAGVLDDVDLNVDKGFY